MSHHHKKTYLITGAAGFIGSRFAESCNQRGISFISVDQETHFNTRVENHCVRHSHIVDLEILFSWLHSQHPKDLESDPAKKLDGIVHLGAITDTRESNLELLQRLNLQYSKSLWNYATQERIPFIYASSAATYGDGTLGYADDESLIPQLHPLNAYGESKQNFDLWVLEQERQGSCPPSWAGFKFFNVYGFGERHKGFMSSVVFHAFDEIQKTGQVTLFKSHREGIADGEQKRDFIYVEDLVQVLHFALDKPISRGIYNLGTGQARTFLDLAKSVFISLKRPEKINFIDTPLSIRDKYQYYTQATMDRLRSEGFFAPFTPLEEGVQQYISRLMKS
jgi:ADP-L-glycero-D-manno-heptose 6-epimerase